MQDAWRSRYDGVLDGHVHMGSIDDERTVLEVMEATSIERMNLVSIQNPETGSGLPQSLFMKAKHPGRFYVFAGLNHAEQLSAGRVQTLSLAEQADSFVEMGCDGIKMIEGKPTARQIMDVPVTDPYFAAYWVRVEALDLPIVWHVNDPEEFWDPARIPDWAEARGWGYGPDDVQPETLYAEVDDVLTRHPNLRIIFAHFYFMSADLERAGKFFDAHPTVRFDLTPGVEMLYNLSRDPEASRDFFIEYADRIVFGTDISSGQSVEEARLRAGLVFRWLETEDTFRVPEEADFLLGPPDAGIIHGLALPGEVLRGIYRKNFAELAGETPKPLDVAKAVETCEQLATVAAAMTDRSAVDSEAARVARALSPEESAG